MKAEYIDHMGSDLSVVNAARVSFDKHHEIFTDGDEKLINYLATHKHELPFAHTAITLRMTAPIPIRTQCFKSKIGFVENEVSRRYVSTMPKYFTPKAWRLKADNKKQGSDDKPLDNQDDIAALYNAACKVVIQAYNLMLAEGVCPEQARFILPQGVMTSWIWTGSLLAFSRFYKLRVDDHAQKEVQDLAKMVENIIAPLYPHSWKALVKINNK